MLITYQMLHAAKKAGTLVELLASMTPAQRVEAAMVCAANSSKSVSHWLGIFGKLMDAASDAAQVQAA
jgi:hypothetical protein